MAKQREYCVAVRATFSGAIAFVMASSSQEAIEKAKAGDWTSIDTNTAELVDWDAKNEAELNE